MPLRRQAPDVDRVTKRFYERFQTEHANFVKCIQGITAAGDRAWYASLMLNRLMFCYFLQKKCFLDGDPHYLRHRLLKLQRRKDKFLTFYRDFLRRLFHEGLARPERSPELDDLLGAVPFVNGGLFEEHELESNNPAIHMPNDAFERLFDFFDAYQWRLDERPLEADNEINPDVLGYIFEKYINQKQMGAYYTKEDITGYIARNTIIPFLFNAAEKHCAGAFRPDSALWRLLRDDPDRYIYPAVRKGVDCPLPPAVVEGIDDITKRQGWNGPATPEYGLPTETWREHVARRQRCQELRVRLQAGEIHAIHDLITYNLDICRFAQDVLDNCEGPELLRAFYEALAAVSVLDPACGSGAFLFAALNVLEPLYEACLDRMQAFLQGRPHPDEVSDFRKTLAAVARHPNRRYFVLKSIILNNLYGVDLMAEAVEICKLRLFLKLVAQLDQVNHAEPLPDMDFNIRPGNALVGYASLDQLKKTLETGTSALTRQAVERLVGDAEKVSRAVKEFRRMQTRCGLEATKLAKAKLELRQRLDQLRLELDRYLADAYGIAPDQATALQACKDSHQPLHWLAEFYGIMTPGGFDVIIGNPPYVELSEVAEQDALRGYELLKTGNLFSLFTERCAHLVRTDGIVGVIVPLSAVCTPRMLPFMTLVTRDFAPLHVSNFAVRPGKLFVGVDMNLSILIGQKRHNGHEPETQVFSTTYQRWQGAFRPFLFSALSYHPTRLVSLSCCIPKLGCPLASKLFEKVLALGGPAHCQANGEDESVYYHSGGRYFRKCLRERLSNEYKELTLRKGTGDALICLLSSSFYYWLWILISDCYHVTRRDIDAVPTPATLLEDEQPRALAEKLLRDLWKHAERRVRTRADASRQEEVNFDVVKSRPILDEIDRMLAKHLDLSPDELDYLLNYDAKFRGRDHGSLMPALPK